MINMLKKILDPNEKEVKRLSAMVERINSLEPDVKKLSDAQLRAKTGEFKERLSNGETLEEILPEAFAVVREAATRTIGQRHFDVQLMGGIILHEGRIAEMKTGEGKTLAATAPVYLNALTGRGVHVVTVNDYLARRDSEWMGSIYKFLGMSVGVILHDMNYDQRRAAYRCDITYGTNNEFGFDYLRDNMVMRPEHMVQRELNYAIVDEVDSILIDEARTPLIISGQAGESTDLYYRFAKIVPRLVPERHYTVDEKARTAALTEEGVHAIEQMLGIDNLYDDVHFELTHYINQALKAHTLFKRDRDYVVKDGQVIIVDEFTGRLMFGRRYSDGLHQAIEAKEGVKIEQESQTLASITFQNYFRMYNKLAGMTGTALTEEPEFQKIYGMDVVVIPTNLPMIRVDHPDVVYKTEKAKFEAVVDEIAELYEQGRPVLVGTISIEKSERLSEMLNRRGIPHNVLNAKYHEREAEIIAQAGRYKAVTIATNMAGRGTDIILGGNPEYEARQQLSKLGFTHEEIVAALEIRPAPIGEPDGESPNGSGGIAAASEAVLADGLSPERVAEARQKYFELLEENRAKMASEHEKVVSLGGLHIIGTERHESRRIDNQLRGRAGRQGDPGSSRFYVSLEDDLMRLFGTDRISGLMERFGWTEDQPIESKQITRSLENAQKKVEAYHFDIRKQVLQYDDVMNQQREVIYGQRRKALVKDNLKDNILDMIREVVGNIVDMFAQEGIYPEDWDLKGLSERYSETLNGLVSVEPGELVGLDNPGLKELLGKRAIEAYEAREREIGPDQFRQLEKLILLRVIDAKWMDHLRAMDELREGIGLRAYGQRDPLLEYKFEAYDMFKQMVASIQEDVVKYMFRVQLVSREDAARERTRVLRTNRDGQGDGSGVVKQRHVKKIGRNDPCPCGSGKKYKKCCGREK